MNLEIPARKMIALADCAVAVSNAKEAAEWWRDKLGFAAHAVGKGPHAVMVAPPGDKFVLHLCEGFEAVQPGNSGVGFVTDDIDGLVRGMESYGVEFPEPLKKESWRGLAKFADPDGNIFWLMEAPPSVIRQEAHRRAPAPRRASRRPVRRQPAARRKRAEDCAFWAKGCLLSPRTSRG